APVIPIRSARSRTDVCSKPCAQKQFIAASSTVVSSNSLGRAIGLLAPAARRCRYPHDWVRLNFRALVPERQSHCQHPLWFPIHGGALGAAAPHRNAQLAGLVDEVAPRERTRTPPIRADALVHEAVLR